MVRPSPRGHRTQRCYDLIDCHDDHSEYDWHCANGSCSCVYDAKEICRWHYPVADGCHPCCPFWGEKPQR